MQKQMDLEEILKHLEQVEKEAASNSTEPLAAHSMLPLFKQLAGYIYDQEAEEDAKLGNKPPAKGQSAYVSLTLLSEIRNILQQAAFENIFDGEEDDHYTVRVRGVFYVLESELRGMSVEDVAAEWEANIVAQLEQMDEEFEDDEFEDEISAGKIVNLTPPSTGANSTRTNIAAVSDPAPPTDEAIEQVVEEVLQEVHATPEPPKETTGEVFLAKAETERPE